MQAPTSLPLTIQLYMCGTCTMHVTMLALRVLSNLLEQAATLTPDNTLVPGPSPGARHTQAAHSLAYTPKNWTVLLQQNILHHVNPAAFCLQCNPENPPPATAILVQTGTDANFMYMQIPTHSCPHSRGFETHQLFVHARSTPPCPYCRQAIGTSAVRLHCRNCRC